MQYPSQEYLASPEGLAERFNYPDRIPPVRSLGFRGDKVPDDRPGMEGKERYINVEYKVQLCPAPGGPVEIKWMPIAEWRDLVGMPQP